MVEIRVEGRDDRRIEVHGSDTIVAAELLVAIRMISSQWGERLKREFVGLVNEEMGA